MTAYTLLHPTAASATPPMLDTSQQAVVAHESGPLLVLAGPGTGKTTTMVEAIIDVIDRRGVDPGEVLALTFSRKAAEQLRDRVTARLGRTLGSPLAATFHSFAYSLVRQFAATDTYAAPLRVLSAAEQDVVLQDLLRPSPEAVVWPAHLQEALRTRGFADEVQKLLDRARGLGLRAEDLRREATQAGRAEWFSAGLFLEQYLDILDAQSTVDYADLVVRAVRLAQDAEVQRALRKRYSWVFVDEYQDTDPAQVALLLAVAGHGRNLVVVGDPDQSIYGFRGAEVRGILDFPERFRTRDGEPAPVVALQTTRRFGPVLLEASRRVATTIPTSGSIPAPALRAFREPVPVEGEYGAGRVDVLTFDTARAETEHIADALRRAHLEEGVPWSDMAVLVRSGRTTIPVLRRSLVASGVPVQVAADDTPLVREPAVVTLLEGLRIALHLDHDQPQDPEHVDVSAAAALLTSPLGGVDAGELRSLARALRARERAEAAVHDRPPRPSPELVRLALVDPALLVGMHGTAAAKAARLGRLLADVRRAIDQGKPAEEALWTLWSGTPWPERLRRSATTGGPSSLLAHRDLDAVCALFEEAARIEEHRQHTGVGAFLEALRAQQLPADTLAERGVRRDAVRLLTAHRAKGLQWRVVVVAHVQESAWPDLRRRSTLLHADQLASGELLPSLTAREMLAEERRLFYVGCTRARQRLLVTGVASTDDDGEQPSRFLTELAGDPERIRHVSGRPGRPLSLAGLVADLRRTITDPASTAALRDAAARRIARLATLTVGRGDERLVPQADPAEWWGTRGQSRSTRPIRDPDEPVRISASTLDALLTCPAQWFLQREAGGAEATSSAQGFGKIVHAIAEHVAHDQVTELPDLMRLVDQVWGQLVFRTPWTASKERAEIESALARFLAWHRRPGARTVIGTETELHAEITIEGERVRLYGFADRLELDEAGRVVVVDLKTGKYPPSRSQVSEHAQLGLYQHAVDHGAADHLVEGERLTAGGAELVQLRHATGGAVKVQVQDRLEPGEGSVSLVESQLSEALGRLRSEEFPAIAGDHCQRCAFTAICPIKGAGTVLSTPERRSLGSRRPRDPAS